MAPNLKQIVPKNHKATRANGIRRIRQKPERCMLWVKDAPSTNDDERQEVKMAFKKIMSKLIKKGNKKMKDPIRAVAYNASLNKDAKFTVAITINAHTLNPQYFTYEELNAALQTNAKLVIAYNPEGPIKYKAYLLNGAGSYDEHHYDPIKQFFV